MHLVREIYSKIKISLDVLQRFDIGVQ